MVHLLVIFAAHTRGINHRDFEQQRFFSCCKIRVSIFISGFLKCFLHLKVSVFFSKINLKVKSNWCHFSSHGKIKNADINVIKQIHPFRKKLKTDEMLKKGRLEKEVVLVLCCIVVSSTVSLILVWRAASGMVPRVLRFGCRC